MAARDITQMGGEATAFPATQWTIVDAARTVDADRGSANIGTLAARYWKPVYAYLRRRGWNNDEAKDLTQGFFGEVVLERGLFARADRTKGRLRTFVLTALDRYVTDKVRRRDSLRRRPRNGRVVPLEAGDEPLPVVEPHRGPEGAFLYAWACQLLEDVLSAVEKDCRRAGLSAHWEVFRQTVVEPELRGAARPPLAELCRRLGVGDERTAANMSITVKRRFRAALRARVRASVASDDEVEEEIRELMATLQEGQGAAAAPAV